MLPIQSKTASRIQNQLASPTRTPLVSAASSATGEDGNWWMITMSDLTLLLLGFLVAWYITNRAPAPSRSQAGMVTQVGEKAPPNPNSIPGTQVAPDTLQALRSEMAEFIGETGLAKHVTIESNATEIVLSLKDTVPFASGKATLRPQVLPILGKIVTVILGQANLSVAISGHTDSLRIATAEFPSNWELSAARASRVARYLIERGVHPSRIFVQGYADYRPRKPNSNPVNRSNNRRVEIRLFHDRVNPREAIITDRP
jgi:chemotaxis protein MotB